MIIMSGLHQYINILLIIFAISARFHNFIQLCIRFNNDIVTNCVIFCRYSVSRWYFSSCLEFLQITGKRFVCQLSVTNATLIKVEHCRQNIHNTPTNTHCHCVIGPYHQCTAMKLEELWTDTRPFFLFIHQHYLLACTNLNYTFLYCNFLKTVQRLKNSI